MSLQEQSSLNKKFLKNTINNYYKQKILREPPLLPMREIAIQPIDSKTYVRHLSFPSMIKLYEYIAKKTPLHLYYSVAVYDNPSAEDMEAKGLVKADIMFDIDVDHYSGCSEVVTLCSRCGYVDKKDLKKCPRCGSKDLVKIPQVTVDCLKRGWIDALKLVDILENEFGANKITVSFSGSRGFHVRVEDEHLTRLDRDERRAIVEYINMSNLDLSRIVPKIKIRGRGVKAAFLKDREYGVRTRLKMMATQLLDTEDYGDYILVDYRELSSLIDAVRVEVDTVVTIDTSRLSRFIYSINGKSGLAVCELDPDREFNYTFKDFRIVDGVVKVKPLYDTPKLLILDQEIKLRKNELMKVDAYIGFYLALKNLAIVVDSSDLEVIKPCQLST